MNRHGPVSWRSAGRHERHPGSSSVRVVAGACRWLSCGDRRGLRDRNADWFSAQATGTTDRRGGVVRNDGGCPFGRNPGTRRVGGSGPRYRAGRRRGFTLGSRVESGRCMDVVRTGQGKSSLRHPARVSRQVGVPGGPPRRHRLSGKDPPAYDIYEAMARQSAWRVHPCGRNRNRMNPESRNTSNNAKRLLIGL